MLGESLAHFVPGCGEGVAAKKYLLLSAALLFSALVLREPTTVPSWVPHAFPGLPKKTGCVIVPSIQITVVAVVCRRSERT